MGSWTVARGQTRRVIRICCSLSQYRLIAYRVYGSLGRLRSLRKVRGECVEALQTISRSAWPIAHNQKPTMRPPPRCIGCGKIHHHRSRQDKGQRGRSRERQRGQEMNCQDHLLEAVEAPGSPDAATTRPRVRLRRHGLTAAVRNACANFPYYGGLAPR